MTKGMSRTETTGPTLAENLGWESDLGRASCREEDSGTLISVAARITVAVPISVILQVLLPDGEIRRTEFRGTLPVAGFRVLHFGIRARNVLLLRVLEDFSDHIVIKHKLGDFSFYPQPPKLSQTQKSSPPTPPFPMSSDHRRSSSVAITAPTIRIPEPSHHS
ncbi:hypothetical protein GQ457_02G025100 [Hibiscus cannabinus]